MPVSVTVYGNAAIDGRSEEDLDRQNFEDNGRLSYFAQLIFSRRFSDTFSLQTGASYSYADLISRYRDNGRMGLHLSGRYRLSSKYSFVFTYDAPLGGGSNRPEPGVKYGIEITTRSHAFQIYLGNARNILPQYDMLTNANKPFKDMSFGFTITRLWFRSGRNR
jgi:hypothetical protein